MGFSATLLVWRGSADPPVGLGLPAAAEPFQVRGEWTVACAQSELVGETAVTELNKLMTWSGSPALSAFVFDSDCAFVTGLQTNEVWNSCLVRSVAADLNDLDDEDEIDAAFGRPEDVAAHAAAWSRAAGLTPDEMGLKRVFGVDDAPEIFLGLKLVDDMLAALGLPAKQEPNFYDGA